MSFFSVLLALLIEQLRPLPRVNGVHEALVAWTRWAGRNFDAGREHHAWVVWGVTVVGPTLLVWAIYLALLQFSLLLAFAWNVAVLYVTLGFRHFSHFFTDIRDALDRLIPDRKGEGVGSADLVIEAVPENLELKRKVYAAIEPRMKPGAVLGFASVGSDARYVGGQMQALERFVEELELCEIVAAHAEVTRV